MATRWACLGPGLIAEDFFYAMKDNLSQADHELIAVASRDQSRAQAFADRFQFKRAYGCYDDVAADDEVEVVYISTINANHVELSVKMLEAGKHVLCEKPMAITQNEARRVFEVAKRNKRVFMQGLWTHFFPAYAQIRRELESGSLGNIRLLQASMCFKMAHKADPRNAAGGLMLLGVYGAMLAGIVFKEKPETIKAVATMNPAGDVDVGGCFVLQYKDGGLANMFYHIDAEGSNFNRTATITGDKGCIQIEAPFLAPEKITTPSGTYEFPLKEGTYNFPNSAGLHYEATAMRETILSGRLENDLSTWASSEMVLSITDEVRRQIGLVYPEFD